jgi:hypothetical protein
MCPTSRARCQRAFARKVRSRSDSPSASAAVASATSSAAFGGSGLALAMDQSTSRYGLERSGHGTGPRPPGAAAHVVCPLSSRSSSGCLAGLVAGRGASAGGGAEMCSPTLK